MARLSALLSIIVILLIVGCTPGIKQHRQALAGDENQRLAEINMQLGIGYLKQGDRARAKLKLLTALEKAPHWPPALAAMAYFYQTTGEYAKAKQYYLQALRLDPQSGATLNNYGAFLCQQGNYRESLTYFEQAMLDSRYLKIAEVYENAGLCAAKIPDKRLAEKYLLQSIQQDPSRILPLLDLADIANSQAKCEQALNYLNAYAKQANLNPHYQAMQIKLARQCTSVGQV